eukprot:GSA120T00007649001.1
MLRIVVVGVGGDKAARIMPRGRQLPAFSIAPGDFGGGGEEWRNVCPGCFVKFAIAAKAPAMFRRWRGSQ